jgi:vacuolar protein sorting-associated protein 13A/C
VNLKSLRIVSTAENWKESFINEAKNTIYKMAQLEKLGLFFGTTSHFTLSNCTINLEQFILKPISGVARVKIDKIPSSSRPQTATNLVFDDLSLTLDDDQYSCAMILMESFLLKNRALKVVLFNKV